MAELARKNAAGPLCPAAFSSNLTVLLKRRLRSLLFPEEKKDTETGCAENCRRRTCRLTCLRHSALSAARTHLSRKSVAHIAERRPCARRRQTAGTVDRRIGRRREAAVVATRHCRARVRHAAPRTPRSFPTFCRCRCSFCRHRCCCSRNSSCLRGQSSYPVPPRECGLPPGSATHSCRRSELRTVCRRAPTAPRPLAMPRKRSRAGRWSAKRAPHSCPSLSRAGEGPRQSTAVRPHSAGQSQFSTCPESHSAPHPAHRSEP